MAVPPEVVFDRFFQERCPYKPPVRPEDPDLRLYRGRDDLSRHPPMLQEALRRIQEDFNKVLNDERGAPNRLERPSFHFDYVDSSVQNAIAFGYENYLFIGITIPLLNEMEATSKRLCGPEGVLGILSPNGLLRHYEVKALFATFVRIQLQFAISHEYTHHVNGHVPLQGSGSVFANEIVDTGEAGSLDQQVLELDADGVATYLVLSDLINGSSRPLVVQALKLDTEPTIVQDEVLLLCFVVAAGSFFLVRKLNDTNSFYQLTHPPQSVRMMYLMHSAVRWCIRFRPGLEAAVEESRFRTLMDSVATATFGINNPSAWETQVALLSSESGAAYLNELLCRFDRFNKNKAE
jgi:hypothetical protein